MNHTVETNSVSSPVAPELLQWAIQQIAAGVSAPQILRAMVDVGWQESAAAAALHRAYNRDASALKEATVSPAGIEQLQVEKKATNSPSAKLGAFPDPNLSDHPRLIDVGDRQIEVVLQMAKPRIVVFANFLSEQECDELIAQATPRLQRSRTVEYNAAAAGEAINPVRTSDGMFFNRQESPLISRIERRIATLLHWPEENGEGLQILNYRVGAEYKPHHDYFDPGMPGASTLLSRGGQRIATLLMYLNNPPNGGGTTFPDVGIEIAPQKGFAVFFSYAQATPQSLSLHGGAPVIAGEKWVATKWLREREFV